MIDLYSRDDIATLKSKKKKAIALDILIACFSVVLFVLFLVFTTRENKWFHGISNAIITSGLLWFCFAYLKLKIMPIHYELKFLNKISTNKDECIKVNSISLEDTTVIKLNKTFIICKVNDFEFLIEKEKSNLDVSNIKRIFANDRFVVGYIGEENEK